MRTYLIGYFNKLIMMDDSGRADVGAYLNETYPEFTIVHNSENMGRVVTMAAAWDIVNKMNAKYVFHLQNDFTFNEKVYLDEMETVLNLYPYLAQIALLRQPWNQKETDAGSIYLKDGLHQYTLNQWRDYNWLEQTIRFTDNPALIRASVLKLPYPQDEESEAEFSTTVRDAGYKCAYWGVAYDRPRVTHIGYKRGQDYAGMPIEALLLP